MQDPTSVPKPAFASRDAEGLPLPHIEYPASLPISEKVDDIIAALKTHQVIVVAGDTGSGKSTQLPKICLQAGFGSNGMIGHTQPRRIAARSIASRLSEEMQCQLGEQVGYQFRFQQNVKPQSLVKLMTDGILLAELQKDRHLAKYDCLIIDEAHERTLNIDFILGYLKTLLPRRPDLRVIITSATIDTERFSRHFSGAPIILVEGRMYPVELRYLPVEDEQKEDLGERVLAVVSDIIAHEARGDVLVFLSGEAEIRQAKDLLQRHLHYLPGKEVPGKDSLLILPLYSRLASKDQQLVFQASKARKIILATNVAETSLTIPGIKYVIDSGLARISRYSARSKVQLLPIEKISQASANQRAGRCGRVSNGICYRLYSEQDFDERHEFTEPEIRRTNLAAVILAMESAGLGDIRRFPFIDAPDNKYINDGYKLLHELAAVDAANKITPIGRKLARLPLDPRLAKMLHSAEQMNCVKELLVIVSALALQDVRERPLKKQAQADEAHQRLCHKQSDFLSYLQIWQEVQALGGKGLGKFCRQHYLNYLRMLEWIDIHAQLKRLLKNMKFAFNEEDAGYNSIHKALLSGLVSLVGFKDSEQDYLGPRNTRFVIANRSCLAKRSPKWVMAESLIHTGRTYAFNVAKIYPKWIEQAAEHLVRRDYYDADWDKQRGRVSVYSKCTLYGLTLHTGRLLDYGRIEPASAREIFIEKALVERQLDSKFSFFRHNIGLIRKYEKLEAKHRVRNILINDNSLYQFYDQRIPGNVCSVDSLRNWLRSDAEAEKSLRLDKSLLLTDKSRQLSEDKFPDTLNIKGHDLPLSYVFEPGSESDGVSVALPVYLLSQYSDSDFDLLVPGFLQAKIVAMIKSLPKPLRTALVPAINFAEKLQPLLKPGDALASQLSRLLEREFDITIEETAWQEQKLPAHLRMRYRILDDNGNEIGRGRSIPELRQRLRQTLQQESKSLGTHPLEMQGISHWEQGLLAGDTLASVVTVKRGKHEIQRYPAMVDNGSSVDIRLFEQQGQALAAHRMAIVRLFLLSHAKKMKYLRKNIPSFTQLSLLYSGLGSQAELKHALEQRILSLALFGDDSDQNSVPALYHYKAFVARMESADQEILAIMQSFVELLHDILEQRRQLLSALQLSETSAVGISEEFRHNLEAFLEQLFSEHFIEQIQLVALERYPAYLKAARQRIERYALSPSADAEKQTQWQALYEQYLSACQGRQANPACDKLRWMLEEYRIALFAPHIKTTQPVSPKRIEQQLALITQS